MLEPRSALTASTIPQPNLPGVAYTHDTLPLSVEGNAQLIRPKGGLGKLCLKCEQGSVIQVDGHFRK